MLHTLRSWWQDRLLRRILKNSSYLFSSNSAAVALSMLQGIFAARLLGVNDFGILAGTVIPFASNVNRLLSFRMSELVVKYLSQFLAEGRHDRAAAVVKGAALVEAITSVLAYLVLLLLAPWAARYLAKDPQSTSLFVYYGLVLVVMIVFETTTGVFQVTKLFGRLAVINLIQSIITAALISWAFLAHRGMAEVLAAYFLGKTFTAVAMYIVAFRQLNKTLGQGWWRAPLSLMPPLREMSRFAISTNLQGTVNLVARDSETLLIGYLRSPVEAGYYKIALGLINLVMIPIDPFIATTYSEIAFTIARRQWVETKRVLKRVSAIAGGWTLAAGSGLALTGYWLIPLLYGVEYRPAYPAALLLLVGYGFANILYWNRQLLLAFGMPAFPLKISALAGAVKTALTFGLVPVYGYLVEAAILSSYFVVSITIIAWRGIGELKQRLAVGSQLSPVSDPQPPSG